MSDQLSQRFLRDNKQNSQHTDIHAPDGIRTHNLSRQAAADLHLKPYGHWDRPFSPLHLSYSNTGNQALWFNSGCNVSSLLARLLKFYFNLRISSISIDVNSSEGIRRKLLLLRYRRICSYAKVSLQPLVRYVETSIHLEKYRFCLIIQQQKCDN